MFPVGPNIAATQSSTVSVLGFNSVTFLPFIATRRVAPCNFSLASDACHLRLAGMVSPTSISLASKNLDALVQLVQPLRK